MLQSEYLGWADNIDPLIKYFWSIIWYYQGHSPFNPNIGTYCSFEENIQLSMISIHREYITGYLIWHARSLLDILNKDASLFKNVLFLVAESLCKRLLSKYLSEKPLHFHLCHFNPSNFSCAQTNLLGYWLNGNYDCRFNYNQLQICLEKVPKVCSPKR